MNDISKCDGANCQIKNKCKRYIIKGSEYQSYLKGKEINGECEFYINKIK